MARSFSSKGSVDIFEDGDLSAAEALIAEAPEVDREAPPGGPAEAERQIRRAEGTSSTIDAPRPERAGESSTVESFSSSLKFSVRPSTRSEFDAFKLRLSAALGGVRLNDSNVGRALLDWFLSEAAERVVAAARSRVVQRPPTDDPARMAAFDQALTSIFGDGVEPTR